MVSHHRATRQTPGPPRCYLGNPGQVLPQQQVMPPAAPRVLGKMQPETLRTVELVKPDRKSTQLLVLAETGVTNMLLQALPTDIHEELVSNRGMSTDQIMYKLCKIFQAGGETEEENKYGKNIVLQLLVGWRSPSNKAAEMAAGINKWRRWVVRAEKH